MISLHCHSDLPLSWFIYKFAGVYPPVASWYMGGVESRVVKTLCVCVHLCVCPNTCTRVCVCSSPVQLFATLWTVALQAPLSMGLSRQAYWSGFLLQRIFLTQGSSPCLPHLLHCTWILYHGATWEVFETVYGRLKISLFYPPTVLMSISQGKFSRWEVIFLENFEDVASLAVGLQYCF